MSQFFQLMEPKIDPKLDYVEVPTVEATVEVLIELNKMADITKARGEVMEEQVSAVMNLTTSEASKKGGVRPFAISLRSQFVTSQLVFWPFIEVAKNLCIQPVRIMTFKFFPFFFHLSGDGLPFGQPAPIHSGIKLT